MAGCSAQEFGLAAILSDAFDAKPAAGTFGGAIASGDDVVLSLIDSDAVSCTGTAVDPELPMTWGWDRRQMRWQGYIGSATDVGLVGSEGVEQQAERLGRRRSPLV